MEIFSELQKNIKVLLESNTNKVLTIKKSMIGILALFFTASAFPNPTGGTVVSGSATIGSAGNTTTINQSSDKAIINWNSFSIGAGETTRFNQPSSSSIALNRVTGNDPSSIFGNLSANGKIMLINPNGILFGKGSNVDVAGLIATTAQIKDSDFLNGNHTFIQDANKTAGIVNEGTIKVADTGLAALVAPSVENRGIIQANLGKVVLGSGKAFTVVDTYGDNLIQFATDSELANAKVSNSGTILANGGKVLMTAKAAEGVVDNVINMDGVIEANSVSQRNGEIILSGGNHGIVKVTGTVKAKGQTAGLKGGSVKITGQNIKLLNNSSIDVSGQTSGGNIDIKATDTTQANGRLIAQGNTGNGGFIETSALHHLDITGIQVNTSSIQGKTGTWLLDPQDITIDTAYAANIVNNLANNNVTIQTNATSSGNGDISVNSAINWTSNNSLTLIADRNITINAGINGTNASLFLEAGNQITPNQNGAINVKNFTLQNGDYIQNANGGNLAAFNVRNDFQVNGGSFLRVKAGDGNSTATAYQIVDVYGLQGIGTHLDKFFVLNNNIDASSTISWDNNLGFRGIGNSSQGFSGQLDGKGYVINNLYVNRPKQDYTGLFGFIGGSGVVKNLGLNNVTVNGSRQTGGLAGENDGTIDKVSVSSGTVTSDRSGVSLSAVQLGGLVGINKGSINSTYSGANVVLIGSADQIGGFVGRSEGTISNSYTTGNVTANSSKNVGGFVGQLQENQTTKVAGVIQNSYASGKLNISGTNAAGFVGSTGGNTVISNSFWDINATGFTSGVGSNFGDVTSLKAGCFSSSCDYGSTPNLSALSTYQTAGWNITSTPSTTLIAPTKTWFIFDGNTRPMLMSEWNANVTNSHQLQLMGATLGASYTLANNVDMTNIINSNEVWGTSSASGLGFNPIGNSSTMFSGKFNGQNYIISNLYINRGSQDDVGLFGATANTAVIQNIGLKNLDITGQSSTGGLVGYNSGGTIIKTYSDGNITGNIYNIGGLIGLNQNGAITQSYSAGKVNGAYQVGGLVGANADGNISSSYSTSNVSGIDTIGGFVGYDSNTGNNYIVQSYSTGKVTGSTNTGGFMGQYIGSVVLANNYWNTETSGLINGISPSQVNLAGITGKKSTELMASLSSLSFNNSDWAILPGQSFPYLQWQFVNTPTAISGITSVGTSKVVNLLKNGSAFDTINITSANGFYYKLYSNDSSNTFNAGDTLFAYVNGVSGSSIWRAASDNASASGTTGMDVISNRVTVSGGSTSYGLSNSTLANAAPAGLNLYTVSGTDLTLQNNVNFVQKDGSYYIFDGNFDSQGSGTIQFGGNVTLSTDTLIKNNSNASIDFNTVDGAHQLNVRTGGNVNFNGSAGANTPLNGLFVTADQINLNASIKVNSTNTYGMVLVTNKFINNYGSAALNPLGGTHYLVYSSDPTNDKRGELNYDFKQYNTTYGQAIQGTGNGFLYTIAPNPLTVTLTGTLTKTYDGNNTASLSKDNYLITGGISGDTIILSSNASYDNKNVGNGKSVAANNITINSVTDVTGAHIYGYQLSTTSTSGNIGVITPANLIITGIVADNKHYDATTAANLSNYGNLSGIYAGDVITLDSSAAIASFANKNVGTGKLVTISNYALGGKDAGNYIINQGTNTATTTGNITPANLTVTGIVADNKVYDATTAANLSNYGSLSGIYAGDTVTLDSSAATASFADKNAGTGKLVTVSNYALSGNDAGNYVINNNIKTASTTATITPASLTLSATSDTKAYDGTVYSNGTVATSGIKGNDTVLATQAFASKNALGTNGSQLIVQSGYTINDGNNGNNYTVTTKTANGTITPRSITVTADPAQTKVYGSADPIFTYTTSNIVAGDNLIGSLARTDGENVGNYLITQGSLNNVNNANYTITFTGNNFSITPASLTIKANDTSRLTGLTNPTFSATYIGLVNGDTANVINGLQLTTNATLDSAAGTYDITPSGAYADNYAITYVNGVLTVLASESSLPVIPRETIVNVHDSANIMLNDKKTTSSVEYGLISDKIIINELLKKILNTIFPPTSLAINNKLIGLPVLTSPSKATNTNTNTSSSNSSSTNTQSSNFNTTHSPIQTEVESNLKDIKSSTSTTNITTTQPSVKAVTSVPTTPVRTRQ